MLGHAVVFGAGAIGRGFIGERLAGAGYAVTFVDIAEPLIAALNDRRAYNVTFVGDDTRRVAAVSPVRGLLSGDVEAVTAALAGAALGATAVGARALVHVAPLIAAGVERRRELGVQTPLNLIVCENLPDAAGTLRALVNEHLEGESRVWAQDRLGLANAVIGRMVPEPTPEMCARDLTGIVTEPYDELPIDRAGLRGDVAELGGDGGLWGVPGLRAVAPFAPWIARKLFIHNAVHALMGYLGYRRSWEFGWQALEDRVLRPILEAALAEAQAGLVAAHGWDAADLRAHVQALWPRLANRALADPVRRLARDPLRKLMPGDRLVGAARLAERADLVPTALAWGIAGALAYDAEEDAPAMELQARIVNDGLAAVLAGLCGIDPQEPLGIAVTERYNRLLNGEWSA